jgi:hypothetical protein
MVRAWFSPELWYLPGVKFNWAHMEPAASQHQAQWVAGLPAMVVWNGAGSKPCTCACWLLSCSHKLKPWRLINGTSEIDAKNTNGLDPKWGMGPMCVGKNIANQRMGWDFPNIFKETKRSDESCHGHQPKWIWQLPAQNPSVFQPKIGSLIRNQESSEPHLERPLWICLSPSWRLKIFIVRKGPSDRSMVESFEFHFHVIWFGFRYLYSPIYGGFLKWAVPPVIIHF